MKESYRKSRNEDDGESRHRERLGLALCFAPPCVLIAALGGAAGRMEYVVVSTFLYGGIIWAFLRTDTDSPGSPAEMESCESQGIELPNNNGRVDTTNPID